MPTLVDQSKEARLLIGVGQRDITPPFGIYGPVWGFSTHDGSSRGTHRPLCVTALSFRESPTSTPAVLVGVDLGATGDLTGLEDRWMRNYIVEKLDIPESNLMLASSHSHGAPWPFRIRANFAGGHLIEGYLEHVRGAILNAAREAIETAEACIITFRPGRCDLAKNRNLPDPADASRFLTGYNPGNQHLADDTVMVGRVTRVRDGAIKATVVNYACHPTTLAGDNRLVSPDYVGALRELMSAHTGGAPMVFLQGASGDLGPGYQYVTDPAVADRHGAQLGHAAMSALLGMYPPGQRLEFIKPIESGTALGYWEPRDYEIGGDLVIQSATVGLPAKAWPSPADLERQLQVEQDLRLRERILRKLTIANFTDGKAEIPTQVFAWKLGRIIVVGISCEIDVAWQQEIRAAFPDYAIVAVSDVNYSAIGYVVREELCDTSVYQAQQAPFARGSFTAMVGHCKAMMSKVSA